MKWVTEIEVAFDHHGSARLTRSGWSASTAKIARFLNARFTLDPTRVPYRAAYVPSMVVAVANEAIDVLGGRITDIDSIEVNVPADVVF